MDTTTAKELGIRAGLCLSVFDPPPRNPFTNGRQDLFIAWNDGYTTGRQFRYYKDVSYRLMLKEMLTEYAEGGKGHEKEIVKRGKGQAA